MKHLLLTTIAAVVPVGCRKPGNIWTTAEEGNIESAEQYLAAYGGHWEIVELLIT